MENIVLHSFPTRRSSDLPREQIVTQLAKAMSKAAAPSEQVRMLSRHHHEHHGGRQWFREESGKLVPRLCSSRSEEHTSELQSRPHLVCRILHENIKRRHV